MDLYVDDLNLAAKPLAQLAIGVQNMGEPQVPDAGVSSGQIASVLASLAGAAAVVATSAATSADEVQASAGRYDGTDSVNGRNFESREQALDRMHLPPSFVGPVAQLPISGGQR